MPFNSVFKKQDKTRHSTVAKFSLSKSQIRIRKYEHSGSSPKPWVHSYTYLLKLKKELPEYSMTSSGVFPSTSLAIFSISSRPHFSLALINWLKSLLFQLVNPFKSTETIFTHRIINLEKMLLHFTNASITKNNFWLLLVY